MRWAVLRYANGIAGKKDKWKGRKESEKEIDWQVIHWETEQKGEKRGRHMEKVDVKTSDG